MPIAATVPAYTSVLALTFAASIAAAQQYPTKTVRIVTNEVGGPPDVGARLIAPLLSESLGQPVIIENRPGVAQGGQIVANATPDGHTLLFPGSSFWVGVLFQKMPFDPVKDFQPVTMVANSYLFVVVNPSINVTNVKELIALAKAKPGALNYGTGSTGSSSHLGAEIFKSMAGIDIVRVNYKGVAPALNAVISGEVQMSFPSVASATSLIKAGRLKVLAVTSPQPSALAPGVPTVAASGLPGYEAGTANGIFVPAKTPRTIVTRIHQEVVRVLNRPDIRDKFLATGAEVVGSTPEFFANAIKTEMARLGKALREAGIKPE